MPNLIEVRELWQVEELMDSQHAEVQAWRKKIFAGF